MCKRYKIPVIGKILHVVTYIKNLSVCMCEHSERIDVMQKQIDEAHRQLREKDEILSRQTALLEQQISKSFEEILGNVDWIKRLNRQLSINPTVWGDEARLHISPLAAVFTCFFNTNSGDITIGDYTFAGSNVSILAGSHDMHLEGLVRRDAEIKEGCDIVIGRGVWLASGCIILGPCTIGDNAVIAAGAVVTPGTKVPANEVYAGVPARKIKKIETDTGINDEHILAAVKREKGKLFVSGWSEKRQILYNGLQVEGHWMVDNVACILVEMEEIHILFHKKDNIEMQVTLEIGEEKKEINIDTIDKEIWITNTKNVVKIVKKQYGNMECMDRLFIAIL